MNNRFIDKSIDKVYEYRVLTIIVIVTLTSLMHGLNSCQYTIYNFDVLYYKEFTQNYILDPIIQTNNNGAFVLNIFNSIFKPMLQIPILYIIASIAIKSSIVYMLYLIIDKLIDNRKLALVISLFFILSIGYASHGIVLNGFWGAPIFFRGSVSGLMTLIGIYLLLKDKYYLAIIPFSLAIHLHILYGVTSFAFIFSSFMIFFILKSRKNIKDFLLLSLAVGLSILIIILNIDSSSYNTINSSIESWYKYVFATDPDDMSMLYFLGTDGYFTIPFIFISLYFFIFNKGKQTVDYLFIGSFILFSIIMIIELLHFNSIFFGNLSEKFIGVQFRRGMWILLLFSSIINFVNFQRIIDNNSRFIYPIIATGFIYLFPNIIALYILLFVTLVYYRQINILYLLLISASFIYLGFSLDFFQPVKLYKSLVYILVAAGFISALVYCKVITKQNILLSIVLFFISSTALVGVVKGNFKNDLKIIANNGLFSYPNLLELEKKIYEKQGKVINTKIIDYIRSNNPKKEFVLEYMNNISYGDAVIYNCPIFISRGEIAMPMFSKLFYESFLYKLKIFDIDEEYLFISKGNTLNYIDTKISSFSKDDMIKLNRVYKVRFLISKKRFPFMESVLNENNYFLYDLGKLK